MKQLDIVINIIENLSLALIIVFIFPQVYDALQRRNRWVASLCLGILLGSTAIIATRALAMTPPELPNNIGLLLSILAGVSAGWPAALVTTAIIVFFQVAIGAIDHTWPMVNSLFGSLLGSITYWQRPALKKARVPIFPLLGVMSAVGTCLSWFLLTPSDIKVGMEPTALIVSVIYGLLTWSLLSLSSWHMKRIQQNCNDIADLQRTEKALRLSEASKRMFINSTNDVALLVDLQGQILEANEMLATRLGTTVEKLIGTNTYAYYPSEIAQLRREKAQEVVRLKHSIRFDSNIKGIWLEQTVSPCFDEKGEVISLAIVSRDITDQKRAEEALRQSEDAHRSLALTLEQRVHERTHELEVLYKVSAASSSSLAIQDMLNHSLALVVEGMRQQQGSLYLVEPDIQPPVLQLAASYGMPQSIKTRVSKEGCPINEVARQNETILITELSQDYPCHECSESSINVSGTSHSYLGVPMHTHSQVLGVISIFGKTDCSFTIEEIALMETLADQIAISVENARLRQKMEQAAVEEERARLGRELHDSISQQLYSMMLFTESARKSLQVNNLEQTQHLLDRIFDLSHQSLKEMRLMVYELRPLALEHTGLVEALRYRLETVEKRSGMQTDMVVQGDLDHLPQGIEQELYRMAIEALNNAAKHSRADSIQIDLKLQQGRVELDVSDNGSGFDLQSTAGQGGIGLRSLRERSARLHGEIEFKTAPGMGTQIHIRVPVE